MRRAMLTLLIGCLPLLAGAQAVEFKIEAGSAESALTMFGRQSGLQTLYQHEAVVGRNTHSVKGSYDPREALERLLQGTGLTYKFVNDHTITIYLRDSAGSSSVTPPAAASFARDSSGDEERKSGSFASRPIQASPAPPLDIEEIVVTAQKREESLLSVPVPVTSISANALVDDNLLRMQDYYARVPGLGLTIGNTGQPSLAIRGLSTGNSANPTVGIVVDDAPFGSSTALGFGYLVPDIDPSDLARIEVLRGPQGTLYGASSLGGLIKFVTVDPSTDGISGRAEVGAADVRNGGRVGYLVRGAVNIPLSDTWALRASGFYHDDAGYIDNVQTGERGTNRGATAGAHITTLWKPSDGVSLKLSALVQDSHRYGSPDVYAGLGDLRQDVLRGTGGASNSMQAYSATLQAKLGASDLTVASAYSINKLALPLDLTTSLGAYVPLLGFPVTSAAVVSNSQTEKFTQEVRLAVPLGERFDWLLGLFYTHEVNPSVTGNILAINPANGISVGTILAEESSSTYAEYAAFTDLTVHVTERLDIQFGGRESQNEQHYSTINAGPYVTDLLGYPSPLVQPQEATRDNSFTYLMTPSFKLSPDLMIYARLASGYRAGGPNTFSALYHLPPTFAPDKTNNYEIGAKGTALQRTLTFDASVYYIDWKNIQLNLLGPPPVEESYFSNGGRAKSEGVELSVEATPWHGMTVDAWAVWNEAVLTQSFPASSAAYGNPGDRLPYGAKASGNVSAQQTFSLTHGVSGFAGATESYIGNRYGEFASIFGSPLRQVYSPYAQTDLRIGAREDSWTLNLYVNNVMDKRGQLAGGIGFFPTNAFTYIQPRTAGFSVVRTF